MAKKIFKSRIYDQEWEIDGMNISHKINGINKSVEFQNINIKTDIGGNHIFNGLTIPSSPRGHVVNSVWCPTVETAIIVRDENAGSKIEIYDEAIK
jgi:hypothetical protein